MSANRMQIRSRPYPTVGGIKTSGFKRPRLAYGLVDDRIAGCTAANLKYFEVLYANSSRLHPDSGLRPTYNTLFNAIRSANGGYSLCGPYYIWFEAGVQIVAVGSVQRITHASSATGQALQINTVGQPDSNTAATPHIDMQVNTFILLSHVSSLTHPYNGEWKVIVRNATSIVVALDTTGGMTTTQVNSAIALSGTLNLNGCAVATPRATVAYQIQKKLQANPDWVVRKNGPGYTNRKVSWTTQYAAYDMNIVDKWVTPDANQKTWTEWAHDDQLRGKLLDQCNSQVIFIDNFMDRRGDAINNVAFNGQTDNLDLNTDGVMETRQSTKADWRTAYADLCDYIRAQSANPASGLSKNLKIIGNYDGGEGSGTAADGTLPGDYGSSARGPCLDYSFAENVFDGIADASRGTLLGGSMGFKRYFNPGAIASNTHAVQNYVGKLRPGGGYLLGLEPATWDEHESMRFCTAMAWLHPLSVHMVMQTKNWLSSFPTSAEPKWLDEWRIALGEYMGTASGTILNPIIPTAPEQDDTSLADAVYGLWVAHYENGVVLCNASSQAKTYNVPSNGRTYRNVNGVFYPTICNGQVVTSITVPAWSGRVLVNNDPGF